MPYIPMVCYGGTGTWLPSGPRRDPSVRARVASLNTAFYLKTVRSSQIILLHRSVSAPHSPSVHYTPVFLLLPTLP